MMSEASRLARHGTVLLAVILLFFAGMQSRFDLWVAWGVPHLPPGFVDLHAILSASDCFRQGYDVFLSNPCDVGLRPLGYSRVWLLAGALGFGTGHTAVLGYLLGAAFLAAAAYVVRPQRAWEIAYAVLLAGGLGWYRRPCPSAPSQA